MFIALHLLEMIYGAQDPLQTMCNELSAIQKSSSESAIYCSAEVEKILTELRRTNAASGASNWDPFEWAKQQYKPFFQQVMDFTRIFFVELVTRLTPLIDNRAKLSITDHKSIIENLKSHLQCEALIYRELNTANESFHSQVDSAYPPDISVVQRILLNSLSNLFTQFYSKQKSIVEEGRLKALQILLFLENFVEEAGKDVDELSQMMDCFSMEEQGATASPFGIPEGETGQGQQEEEKME